MKGYCTVLTAVCAALGCIGCGSGEAKTGGDMERFTVSRVDIRDVMSETGEVRPLVKVEVKSEAGGRIERVDVKQGQRVSKGDTLITIDPERLLYQRDRVSLGVRRARIKREQAQRDLENARALRQTGTVSEKQLEDLRNESELADITYRQELLELKDIQDQLDKTVVTAPMDGVLTSLDVEEGEIAVSAVSGFQSGTTIGTVADVSRLEVVSEIGEADYVHLTQGDKVVIRPQAFDEVATEGTVTFVSLTATRDNNEELGSFEVRMSIDSVVSGIAPGINVHVEFVLKEKENVLGVPAHFVHSRGKRHFVEVLRGEGGEKLATERVPVELGMTDYRNFEVLDGLSEGDVVVYREEAEEEKPRRGGRKGH